MNKRIKKKWAKLKPKPCPYCGSKVEARYWLNGWWQIQCDLFYCENPFYIVARGKKNAIKFWNKHTRKER